MDRGCWTEQRQFVQLLRSVQRGMSTGMKRQVVSEEDRQHFGLSRGLDCET